MGIPAEDILRSVAVTSMIQQRTPTSKVLTQPDSTNRIHQETGKNSKRCHRTPFPLPGKIMYRFGLRRLSG